MKKIIYMIATVAFLSSTPVFAESIAQITHNQFQAVNSSGEQTYNDTEKVILTGILLNNPAEYLDPTPDDSITELFNLSGQWQIYIQGEGSDHAGTVVWLGQMYSNLPWVAPNGGYTNEEFISELTRINTAQFSPGDRIKVTGYFLSYKGKMNINEQHNKYDDHNFTIELLQKGVGQPTPELITLNELKDSSDNFIFDPNRLIGCEYYQSRLVRINNVNFTDPALWDKNATMEITDGLKTFPVTLCIGNGIYPGSNNLDSIFDIIGILDQEDMSGGFTAGYRIIVTNYDGNGQILATREHRQAANPADTNLDGIVDFIDFAKLAENWLN